MKRLSVFFLSLLSALPVLSQQNTSALTVHITGNKNLQVSVDGTEFNLANSTVAGSKTSFALNNLETGQHTIQVARTDQSTGRTENIPVLFNLRHGYDLLINVNENGSLELTETKRTPVFEHDPMSSADFNALLKTVRNQSTLNGRRSVIANAFNNSNNYFTTFQTEQLLQLVNSESYRLQLAKLSYRGITDPDNFNLLYDLFSLQSSKNELAEYVNSYKESNNSRAPLPDADFNNLYQDIKKQWPVSAQVNAIANTFKDTSYYFTVNQAGQLIQIVFTESSRLELAKASYRSIVDTANFSQVYSLLSSQASKNELAAFVRNYNQGNYKPAMPDADFNIIYQDIKKQWPVSAQVNALITTFKDSTHYFSVNQASQLIQIVFAESSRLQLAKASYRSIVDTANFSQVYGLLSSQASKDALKTYVNNYNSGNIPRTAMPDTEFNALYETIQLQFFPGEKMTSLTTTFNNKNYYFSCAQAKKLIQLVSLESNRLQLAKLSYRSITDRENFRQLYDLFKVQANKNALDAYVKAYKE